MRITSSLRFCVPSLILMAGFFGSGHAAHAGPPTPHVPPSRLYGQVIAVTWASGNPTKFTLLVGNRSVVVRTSPTVTYRARSAEAAVDGFTVNEFAAVAVRHFGRMMVAQRIVFDVRPFGPIRDMVVTGAIVAINHNGNRFWMRLDTGMIRTITLTRTTKFRMDGQLLDTPPVLSKGQTVEVFLHKKFDEWVAVEVDV